jgi:hypothetical protein
MPAELVIEDKLVTVLLKTKQPPYPDWQPAAQWLASDPQYPIELPKDCEPTSLYMWFTEYVQQLPKFEPVQVMPKLLGPHIPL